MKTVENIFKKLNSYAEQQFNNEKFKNMSFIKKKLENKEDLFERGYKYETIQIDNTYPNFIFNNQEKLKEFIYNE